jgi:hypothetical protein
MQLLMKVSRAAARSFLASAELLHARMRCWTLRETGVAGTTCTGGVAVTGREAVSARTPGMTNASSSAAQRESMRRQ